MTDPHMTALAIIAKEGPISTAGVNSELGYSPNETAFSSLVELEDRGWIASTIHINGKTIVWEVTPEGRNLI